MPSRASTHLCHRQLHADCTRLQLGGCSCSYRQSATRSSSQQLLDGWQSAAESRLHWDACSRLQPFAAEYAAAAAAAGRCLRDGVHGASSRLDHGGRVGRTADGAHSDVRRRHMCTSRRALSVGPTLLCSPLYPHRDTGGTWRTSVEFPSYPHSSSNSTTHPHSSANPLSTNEPLQPSATVRLGSEHPGGYTDSTPHLRLVLRGSLLAGICQPPPTNSSRHIPRPGLVRSSLPVLAQRADRPRTDVCPTALRRRTLSTGRRDENHSANASVRLCGQIGSTLYAADGGQKYPESDRTEVSVREREFVRGEVYDRVCGEFKDVGEQEFVRFCKVSDGFFEQQCVRSRFEFVRGEEQCVRCKLSDRFLQKQCVRSEQLEKQRVQHELELVRSQFGCDKCVRRAEKRVENAPETLDSPRSGVDRLKRTSLLSYPAHNAAETKRPFSFVDAPFTTCCELPGNFDQCSYWGLAPPFPTNVPQGLSLYLLEIVNINSLKTSILNIYIIHYSLLLVNLLILAMILSLKFNPVVLQLSLLELNA